MNRFGISLWNWTPVFSDEHLGLIDKVAEIGLGAVEIGMSQTDFNYAAVKERVEANDLELTLCAALVKGRDISSFDENIRSSTKQYMIDCFKAAKQMNARLFVGPVYAGGAKAHNLNIDDRKREWELAVNGLKEMADIARECGVVIGVEPVNRYRTSVVNTVEQALQMVADIDKANTKFCLILIRQTLKNPMFAQHLRQCYKLVNWLISMHVKIIEVHREWDIYHGRI